MQSVLLAAFVAATLLQASGATAQAVATVRSTLSSVETTTAPSLPRADKVQLTSEVLDNIAFLYHNITHTEFVLCLEGSAADGVVTVDNFRLAHMIMSSDTTATYEKCSNPRYVGTAHNHPPVTNGALCFRSAQDQKTWHEDQSAIIDVVFCGDARYKWFTRAGTYGGQGV